MLAVGGYMAIMGAMAVLWATLPLVAAGAAIIAAPTIGHPAAVTALFVAMSDGRAAILARIVIAGAPVALLVTAVGIAVAWRGGSRQWVAAMASCLILLLAAPLAHTRAVLGDMTLGRWLATGGLVSAVALVGRSDKPGHSLRARRSRPV